MLSQLKRLRLQAKPPFSLQNKVAVITGGAEGIGWETAQLLRRQGCKIAIIDRNATTAQAAAHKLDSEALAICADVTQRDAMNKAVHDVIAHFGKVDLVIANAGITPSPTTLRTGNLNDFDAVLSVNITGVLNTVHPAIESLITQGGHILVVASCAAFCPPVAGAAYMVSKAAVEQLARGLKLELATHGVTVTTAYLGVVDTQLAKATLDGDPIGQALNQRLPKFLQKRLSAAEAAHTLVAAITRRSPTVIAPAGWLPYAWLRGIANPILDKFIIKDSTLHALLRKLEQRNLQHAHKQPPNINGDEHA